MIDSKVVDFAHLDRYNLYSRSVGRYECVGPLFLSMGGGVQRCAPPFFVFGKAGEKMAGNVMLHVDTSQLRETIEALRTVYTQEQFQKMMVRVFSRTSGNVRRVLSDALPHDYQIRKKGWINESVGAARISISGASVNCVIPVKNVRGRIGGDGEFKAKAGSGKRGYKVGYASQKVKGKTFKVRRRYKVEAQVVTAGTSTLPSAEGNRGGVHFMQFTGRYRGQVWARMPDGHVRPAVGIGVPQMPTTRSREAVQQGIMKLLENRMAAESNALLKRYAK